MRRREFLTILSGAAMAPLVWPDDALAQQPRNSTTIGFLGTTTPTIWSANVTAFQNRLRELGWIDGRNVSIEYRWAQGRDDRYAEFAGEFVQRKVDIIVTAGTTAVIALKKATSAIPIVFAAAGDPVRTGLVSSLSRPGGNVTGLSNLQTDLGGRRLSLLREIQPNVKRVAVLGNFDSPLIALEMEGVKEARGQAWARDVQTPCHQSRGDRAPPSNRSTALPMRCIFVAIRSSPRIGFASIPWRSPRNCRL